jgi:hypothetical protein
MAVPPRTSIELDALLTRELAPLIERLADEYQIVTTAVCVVEDTGLLSVISCMTLQMARTSLTAALDAHWRDNSDA